LTGYVSKKNTDGRKKNIAQTFQTAFLAHFSGKKSKNNPFYPMPNGCGLPIF
jgi:hypothetical protein